MLQSRTRSQVSESDCTANPTNKAQQSVCHISRLYRYYLFPFHISKSTHSHHTPNFVLNYHHVKMAQYPVAHDPADNASLRQKYREGQGVPMRMAYVKENMIPTGGLWVMQNTEANSARYMSLFDSENAPTTNIEALEQAGATFYPHCMYCHGVRSGSANSQI